MEKRIVVVVVILSLLTAFSTHHVFAQSTYEEVKREATLKLHITAGRNCEYEDRNLDALKHYEKALAFVDSAYGTESVKVLEPLASVVRVEKKLRMIVEATSHYVRLAPLVRLHTEGAPEDVRQSWEKVLKQIRPY